MNSPLNYCDGLKHFYDVEYAMELAHFQVPKDFSRAPSSNEVVFSELKDLMVCRFQSQGVRVLCSTSTLKMRQIESLNIEDIQLNSLPASFTKWRCLDGSNIFHILCNSVKGLGKFLENYDKLIDQIEIDQRETALCLTYMQILYPDNNGVTPFDIAMKLSS